VTELQHRQTRPGSYGAAVPLRRLEEARWINWGDDLGHLAPARLISERVPAAKVMLRTSQLAAAARVPRGPAV
jgi:hypothetical protein